MFKILKIVNKENNEINQKDNSRAEVKIKLEL